MTAASGRDDGVVGDLGHSEQAARTAELAANLAGVRARIEAACQQAGRDPADVRLIAVTKTFPASDVLALSRLGVTDFGENRDQEAAPKAAQCAADGVRPSWHFVGQLQANKVASVVGYADMVHSVDRMRLVRALARRAAAASRVIGCFVQVSLDDGGAKVADGGRGGAPPEQVLELAGAIAAESALSLAGVMALAPPGAPARPAYARLREVAYSVRSAFPAAVAISAGMSADLAEAIAEGATHVRIGTALLGGRRAFVR
jgi:pyridoxal phosphate enzyme (YggS family)